MTVMRSVRIGPKRSFCRRLRRASAQDVSRSRLSRSSRAPKGDVMAPDTPSAPEFREWSIAAVRLLQGVVYADDAKIWDIVLRSGSQLESYLARIGLSLVIDESEGYAYVRQWSDDECPAGYEQLPRLI